VAAASEVLGLEPAACPKNVTEFVSHGRLLDGKSIREEEAEWWSHPETTEDEDVDLRVRHRSGNGAVGDSASASVDWNALEGDGALPSGQLARGRGNGTLQS